MPKNQCFKGLFLILVIFYFDIFFDILLYAKECNICGLISHTKCMTKKQKILSCFELVGVGLVAGFINGFFGAGGGLLLVPMISCAAKVESKKAHATTLMCVLFMCIASSIIYFVKHQLDFKLILVCGIGSVIGSFVGTKLLKKLKNNVIDMIFAVVLVIAGVCMIIF